MNLILIFPSELDSDSRVRLTGERARHIRTILHAEPGQTLRVGLLDGSFGCGTVEAVCADGVTLVCKWESDVPPRPAIDLLLAMPRPKVLKRLWAQLAALGVGRIIITNAEKVERYYFDTHILDPDFYIPHLVEGLQQARDTHLPSVTIARYLRPFLEDELTILFPEPVKKFLADPSGEQTIFQTLQKPGGKVQNVGKRVLLAVGPEGGWTPYELDLFRAHGFELFGLGSRILRTDTACVALLGIISALGSHRK